jgi:acyl carrier protein
MAETPPVMQVEARLNEALVDLGVPPDELTRETRLAEYDLDSVDLVDIAQIMKDEFEIEVPARDLSDVKAVGDVLDAIMARAGAT